MMKYLEGEELTEEEIKAGIRKATITGRNDSCNYVVLHTRTKVFKQLLDAVVDYMPSPVGYCRQLKV